MVLLHTVLELIISHDVIILSPLQSHIEPNQTSQILIFHRTLQTMQVQVFSPFIIKEYKNNPLNEIKIVFGIIGLMTLKNNLYLTLIQHHEIVAFLDQKPIYRLVQPLILKVGNKSNTSSFNEDNNSITDKKLEQALEAFKSILSAKDIYFSYDLDISNTMQKRAIWSGDGSTPLWERVRPDRIFSELGMRISGSEPYPLWDDRFFHNRAISSALIELKLHEWILPVFRGYVDMDHVQLDDYGSIKSLLISRRSRFRDGTRYNTRGIDAEGHVANYVETEFSLQLPNSDWISFVQTRGSIPLLWEQTGFYYQPSIKIHPDQHLSWRCFEKHLHRQIQHYGSQYFINLLQNHASSSEKDLCMAFESCISNYIDQYSLEYIPFDVKRFDIAHLIEIVSSLLDKIKYGHIQADDNLITMQQGIIRTNCLDCIDRTNMVQTSIWISWVTYVLKKLNVNVMDKQHELMAMIRRMSRKNGDASSFQYAGTASLKNSISQLRKGYPHSYIVDGFNSISRYYAGQFKDDTKQMGIDLLNGTFQIKTEQHQLENELNMQKMLYIWNKEQLDAIQNCIIWLEEGVDERMKEKEAIYGCIVISINFLGLEQERILILTKLALYRIKYNYKKTSQSISSIKRLDFKDMDFLQIGEISGTHPIRFGCCIYFKPCQNKPQDMNIYCWMDYSRDMLEMLVDLIMTQVQESGYTDFRMVEGSLEVGKKMRYFRKKIKLGWIKQ